MRFIVLIQYGQVEQQYHLKQARKINGYWLVYFTDPITAANTIGIPIKEEGLKVL